MEQISIAFKRDLTAAISRDIKVRTEGNREQEQEQTMPKDRNEDGGVSKPTSNASRQLAAALLLQYVVEVLLESKGLPEQARVTLLAKLAVLNGVMKHGSEPQE